MAGGHDSPNGRALTALVSDGTPTSSRLRRTSRLGGLVAVQGGRIAGGRALDRVRSDEGRDRAQAARTADVVEQIVVQLGKMKGAAMKIGQVISTVEFPGMEAEAAERIQRRLAELRDAAPTVRWSRIEKLMVAEWGEPVSAVLADIEPEAMAAASIGQVHRATTRDGVDVAVKVQYPGIAEAVEADLRNLRLLLPLLGRLAPGLDTKALGDELRERISEELDYELEAANQRRVWRWWRGHPHVLVPRVDTALSTRRVLVSELHEGMRFDDLKTRRTTARRDRVAEIVHRFYYATAADHGLVLGDPHPGNWQSLDDGRVVMFDFGMVRTASGRARRVRASRGRPAAGDPRPGPRRAVHRDARPRLPRRRERLHRSPRPAARPHDDRVRRRSSRTSRFASVPRSSAR